MKCFSLTVDTPSEISVTALYCLTVVARAGILGEVAWPEGVRVDTWVETGSTVTPYYDSLLAKLMVFAPTRKEAIAKLMDALGKTRVSQSYIELRKYAQLIPLVA